MSEGTQKMAVMERPLLFSGEMVRAILSGKKTQTRRPVKLVGHSHGSAERNHSLWRYLTIDSERNQKPDGDRRHLWQGIEETNRILFQTCPLGAPGDALYVRETTFIAPPNFCDASTCNATDDEGRPRLVGYVASMDAEAIRCAEEFNIRRTPSMHMPRWASRLKLDITSVRVQRVQDISPDEVLAEGLEPRTYLSMPAYFSLFWDEIYSGYEGWNQNPFVWAIAFEWKGKQHAHLGGNKTC